MYFLFKRSQYANQDSYDDHTLTKLAQSDYLVLLNIIITSSYKIKPKM